MASSKVGFVTMGEARSGDKPIPDVGIGMLGYAFMGKAHVNAYKTIPYIYWPPPARPRLVAIAGRNEANVREAAHRYGFEGYYTDWRQMLDNDEVQIFDNGAPNNLHAEPCIAAAKAGKHVICEKPLARTAAEAKQMLDAVRAAGVKHTCAFNQRFIPALRLVKNLVDQGALGRIFHFRARYLQEWIIDPDFPLVWRMNKDVCGSGSLGDLAAHSIDLARWLVGEPKSVMATLATFVKERPLAEDPSRKGKVEIDDAVEAVVEFQNGAVGTLEATRFASGRKNQHVIEINGSKGSIAWDQEDISHLQTYFADEPNAGTTGFHNVLVSEATHPFWDVWWPHGHVIGWEHSFIHQLHHFIDCVVHNKDVAPDGATFDDGYRCAVICDAIQESAREGRRVEIEYQD